MIGASSAKCCEGNKFTSLLSIYRQKSMATYREMYKLYDGSSQSEKAIVIGKVKELETMREYLKPEILRLISNNFNETDAKEFVNSRFLINDMVNHHDIMI